MSAAHEVTVADVQAFVLADVEHVLPLIRNPDVPEEAARTLLLNCLSAKCAEGMSRGFSEATAMVDEAQS